MRKKISNWLENMPPEEQREFTNMVIKLVSVCIIIGIVIILKVFQMNTQEKIGKIIKDERTRQGLSLDALADKVFNSKKKRGNYISKIERGKTNFTIKSVVEILLALDINLADHIYLKRKK